MVNLLETKVCLNNFNDFVCLWRMREISNVTITHDTSGLP